MSGVKLPSCALLGAWLCFAAAAQPARGEEAAVVASAGRATPPATTALTSALARAEARIGEYFAAAGVTYPPRDVALVALKHEARLEVWAGDGERWSFVRSHLVRPASGRLGPKLRQGDHQVPEGVYRITALNPASSYHLSLRLDYPNAFDRARAARDGRVRLGGDIMIHGGRSSAGCLSVGDTAVEELFALVSRVGLEHVAVIVSPLDLRRTSAEAALERASVRPAWLPELYTSLAAALAGFQLEDSAGAAAPAPSELATSRARCRAYDAADCSRRCARGDAASCARAGLMARDGRGAPRDPRKAWTYLSAACAGGDALGCAELALLLLEDAGPRRDAARAAELARLACDSGQGHGCAVLANLCIDQVLYPEARQPCGRDDVRRLRDRAVAALAGDCRGWGAYDCDALAAIYASGDRDSALRFASASCEGGDPGGCYSLARLSGDGAGAHALYSRACNEGFSSACEKASLPSPLVRAAAGADAHTDAHGNPLGDATGRRDASGTRSWRRTFGR